jgi:hypothetical protein
MRQDPVLFMTSLVELWLRRRPCVLLLRCQHRLLRLRCPRAAPLPLLCRPMLSRLVLMSRLSFAPAPSRVGRSPPACAAGRSCGRASTAAPLGRGLSGQSQGGDTPAPARP